MAEESISDIIFSAIAPSAEEGGAEEGAEGAETPPPKAPSKGSKKEPAKKEPAKSEESEESEPAEEPEESEPEESEPEEEWTPAVAKKARQELETREAELAERNRELEAGYRDLSRKQGKFKSQRDHFVTERGQVEALKKQLKADMEVMVRGDTRAILSTMARLTGKDPIEFYREMGELLATDGKSGNRSRVDEETKRELEETRRNVEELRHREQVREQARQAEAHNNQVIQGVYEGLSASVVDAETYPDLAAYAEEAEFHGKDGKVYRGAEAVSLELLSQLLELQKQGRVMTVEEACLLADRRLSSVRRPGPDTGANKRKPGTSEPDIAAKAKDRTGQRSPGVSISPSTASANGGKRRPLTERETEAVAYQMIQGAFPALFGDS